LVSSPSGGSWPVAGEVERARRPSGLAGARPYDATALRKGPRGERGHAHGHERPFRGRQWTDGGQELIGSSPIHGAQDGVAPMGQHNRPLAAIVWLLAALHKSASHEAIDQPAGRRWGTSERFGKLPDCGRASVRENVQGGELGEPEAEITELGRKPDHELAPERPTHGDAFRDLTHVRDPRAGQDRGTEVGLEPTGDRPNRGSTGSPSSRKCI